jgi:hypothetical protein
MKIPQLAVIMLLNVSAQSRGGACLEQVQDLLLRKTGMLIAGREAVG